MRMILSRRRALGLFLAAAASTATGLDAVAKTAHAAHHAAGHAHAGGHGHAGAHSHSGHGKLALHSHKGANKHLVSRRAIVSPQLRGPMIARNTDDEAPRRLFLHNLHTDEKLDAVYFENGRYLDDALQQANLVLRDFRSGDVHPIQPELFDLLHDLRDHAGIRTPFQVISGYRSPSTNALLQEKNEHSGVATHSYHMQGMAMDIRANDVSLSNLHRIALAMGRGGVGYYPGSDFVHVDVGPVRQWNG